MPTAKRVSLLSSRKRLEEKLSWFLIRGDLSCRSPLLKKVSTGHFFQFTPAERLRMQGVSPSAEGDQGRRPLDPCEPLKRLDLNF